MDVLVLRRRVAAAELEPDPRPGLIADARADVVVVVDREAAGEAIGAVEDGEAAEGVT